jgi:hypothetical protein
VASYAVVEVPGALSQAYNAGQGNYNVVMAIVSFIFLCGSLRINVPFVIVFLGLVFLFSFAAAADYQLGFNATAEGLEHAVHYIKIAGGFGFVSMIMGWYVLFPSTGIRWDDLANWYCRYLAIITICASTGVPCPLPIFDLSQRVFSHNRNAQKGEHAGAITESRA